MPPSTNPVNREPVLFLILAGFFLGILVVSLSCSYRNGEDFSKNWPFLLVTILELTIPAALCILAAIQSRRGKNRGLIITALCICGLLMLGFALAPFLMLAAGTLTSYVLFFVFLAVAAAAFVIYFWLLISVIQRLARNPTHSSATASPTKSRS